MSPGSVTSDMDREAISKLLKGKPWLAAIVAKERDKGISTILKYIPLSFFFIWTDKENCANCLSSFVDESVANIAMLPFMLPLSHN